MKAHISPEALPLIVAVLRDPQYRKGKEFLRPSENCLCLEGAVCEAYHRATGDGNWDAKATQSHPTVRDFVVTYADPDEQGLDMETKPRYYAAFAPAPVKIWATQPGAVENWSSGFAGPDLFLELRLRHNVPKTPTSPPLQEWANTLIGLNDSTELSLDEMADYLEYESYFAADEA